MEVVVEATALTKRFGAIRALDRVTFSVHRGDIFGVVGPNGAGKTTLFDVLLNLHRATSGEAHILGRPTRALRSSDFQQIGYVSESQHIPDSLSADQYLAYLQAFYPGWDSQLTARLLSRFEVPTDRPLKRLSRGMRMKVLLTLSLAFRPKLLLMDEPFSGFDPLVRDEILTGILDQVPNITVLIASHEIQELEQVVSHIGYLHHGRFQFIEEAESLLARFREVTLRFPIGKTIPEPIPAHWLHPEFDGTILRFIDSAWDEETSSAQLQCDLGAQTTEVRALSLRDIVVALTRASRVSNERGAL